MFFACSGFPSGAAGSRECRLVETTRPPVRCPPVRLHAASRFWAAGARCAAAGLPDAFTRCVPGRFPGPLHSAGTGRFAGRDIRRLSGDGRLGEMPGGVPLAGRGRLGAFGRYGHQVVMLQERDPLDAAGGRQGHAGQPPAVWPAVPARRLWALHSARCRVTEGPSARYESTRSRSVRARMCARRLTRPSSMTMRSASARASGFLPWSFPRRARAAALPTSRLARPPAAVTLRSPRRLRRSPEDAPLRPAGALVNRTTPADYRLTDPRGSVSVGRRCAREGRAAGAGPGRLVCRRDTPRPGRR